jgi:RNA 2',3'-cyclic 3'-phosphodiesterase
MRIFVALNIDDVIRERITRFAEGVRGFAPEARWVRPESLHLTLKFIGEEPDEEVERIKRALVPISARNIAVSFRGYGFFPTLRAARVFWVGIEAGPHLGALAEVVDRATAALGVPREQHPFRPHLTLARGGSGSGAPRRQLGDARNRDFQLLQEKLAALPVPDFGAMTAREFCLYQSQLMRGGSRYTKIARFPLVQD